ncbi:hypothetical protein B0H10DRAFT_2440230 [Mycena sp. CBHHK59/15]|nr:hypothetical protein B0H10DRAFT_2440230 [Mycena sp. CBHHK59/15]
MSHTHLKTEKADYAPVDDMPTNGEDDYPHGIKLALLTLVLCLSVFLVALDNTIIATAIPKITDQFESLDDMGVVWFCTTATTQLLFGKFYTFLPNKWVYVTAITIFKVRSVVCSAAPTSVTLLVGHAITGLGTHSVPLAKWPIYSGLLGGMYGIASCRCFYINLPIGAITLAVIVFLFKMPRSGEVKPDSATFTQRLTLFDPWGTLLFIPVIVCFLLALKWGGSKYAWNSVCIIALFIVFGILISTFVGVQLWKQDHTTIPPRILKECSIWSSVAYAFAIGSLFFILPIWFQVIRGMSAIHSGIDNLLMILSLFVTSIIAGGLIMKITVYGRIIRADRRGRRPGLDPQGQLGSFKPMLATQNVLELRDMPIRTSIIMFSHTLGGPLSISIAQNVFTNKLVSGLIRHVPGVSPAALVLSAGATSLKSAVEPQFLQGVLEAYNEALVAAFYVAIAMACLSLAGALVCEWRSIKGKTIELGMGA